MSGLARLRIVAINDVYELHNLPKLQTFLSRLTSEPSAVTLAGDFLSPSTLSSVDGGRGMVSTLRATGVTHVSLGNHEQDLRLESLHDRLASLSKSVNVINSNMRENIPDKAQWMTEVTVPYSLITSPCNRVRVALLGLLSDEPGIFRDNTFKGVPVSDVIETYAKMYNEIVPNIADACIPLTHQSMTRDKELAESMLDLHGGKGVIIGGHEHEPLDELVGNGSDGDSIRILKAGMDSMAASVIDLSYDVTENERPTTVAVDYKLEPLVDIEPSEVLQQIVDKHMSVIKALDGEHIINSDTAHMLPPGALLSSKRTRFEQTTVGSIFLQLLKEEMDADVAIVNGACIKGGTDYYDGKMTYAQLKKELPFPTKMIVVIMKRWELQDAIDYSRTSTEGNAENENGEIPRRGYLQVDWDYDQVGYLGSPDDDLKVALPRNLLNGFCKIKPLMKIGDRLKQDKIFPGDDDYVPAINLVTRYACKNRWSQMIGDIDDFDQFDLDGNGVLDRTEVKLLMEKFLGHEPADFVVDDMIAALDADENGVIDKDCSYPSQQAPRLKQYTQAIIPQEHPASVVIDTTRKISAKRNMMGRRFPTLLITTIVALQCLTALGFQQQVAHTSIAGRKITLPSVNPRPEHGSISSFCNTRSHRINRSRLSTATTSAEENPKVPFPLVLWRFTRPHTIIGSALAIPALHVLAAPTYASAFTARSLTSMIFAMIPALLMNLYITGLNQVTDVEIDKVNKPNLPIAAGDLSLRAGVATVVLSLILSLLMGVSHPVLGSQGLNVALWFSGILGTLYSLEPFRLKRFPFLAAFCIVSVRGAVINAGFFAHAKAAAFGQTTTVMDCLVGDRRCLLSSLYFAIFGVVIALMKDVPDVKGDALSNVRTFSVRLGQKRVFGLMCRLLAFTFFTVGASFLRGSLLARQSAPLFIGRAIVGLSSVMAGVSVQKEAAPVDAEDPKEVYNFYMHLWKLFYLSYLVLPFAR
ncbi:unnamed protein product [Cylindrotheca closterium]|uniref:EF-hand domain-containing protein n=1 Tax=Cylindrotheca closterium TaxID=2856 RepID=A0AAD2FYR7_9STRA|nr:unnamed protein product [Cylindrotheca closterium]